MKNYFTKKLEKALSHSLDYIQSIKVNFDSDTKSNTHLVEIIVFTECQKTFKNETTSEDMYGSIDLATDNIERQLRRHKEKITNTKRHQASKFKSELAM